MNRLFRLLGYRDRMYRGQGFSLRIEPIHREDFSVVHADADGSVNMNAVWIGRHRMAVKLPDNLQPAEFARLVDNLRTALGAMGYSFQIVAAGEVVADSDSKQNRSRADRWLTFVGRMAVCRWTDVQKKRRIYLITLPDGPFTLWSGHFSDDALEMCWIADAQEPSYYDSQETAVADIHAKFPWSRSVAPEFPPHDGESREDSW